MPENLLADLTTLLEDIRVGKQWARDQFADRVLNEMRELAARFMRQERVNHLLQPTALVNEAFVKLLPGQNLEEFANRAHFFAAAATAAVGASVGASSCGGVGRATRRIWSWSAKNALNSAASSGWRASSAARSGARPARSASR